MPRLPGADFSKISPSFWLTWRRALVILSDSKAAAFLLGFQTLAQLAGLLKPESPRMRLMHGRQPLDFRARHGLGDADQTALG